MTPFQVLVEDLPVPQLLGRIRRRCVDDDLIPVPGLDGGDVRPAALQLPLLDFARPAITHGIRLVACPELVPHPAAGWGLAEQVNAVVTGREDAHSLAFG